MRVVMTEKEIKEYQRKLLSEEYIVIFSDNLQNTKVETKDTRMDIKGILSSTCGLHYKNKRPTKVIIEKPKYKTEVEQMKYQMWLNTVIPICSDIEELNIK